MVSLQTTQMLEAHGAVEALHVRSSVWLYPICDTLKPPVPTMLGMQGLEGEGWGGGG